ncbi:MAG TPA: hypothetical protein VNF68_07965 [Candidatus Baltobacteraceae bacterium]|nr:hypothetical protein [Candidatus Baltobacteraceae bacterium]
MVYSIAAGAAAPAQTVVASSRVVVYTPEHMTARSTLVGACSEKSLRAERSDAYRCTSGATAYDPCFRIGAARAACPTDVFADRGIVVRSTRRLPRLAWAPSPSAPWAMLLASGARCLLHSSARPDAHPFACTSTSGRAFACASPRLHVPGATAYFVDCATTGARAASLGSTLARVIYE